MLTGVETELSAEASAKLCGEPSPETWQAFHQQFRDCFARRETWAQLFHYWMERCGKGVRTEGSVADPKDAGSDRARQRFLSDAAWDEEKILARYHRQVRAALGYREAALVFLEAGFTKKGEESAGTEKQPYDSSGRVRNGQVGILAVYVSRHGAVPVAARLYVPEVWCGEDRWAKKDKCRFPADFGYRTKTRIILEMLAQIREAEILPFRYVLVAGLPESARELIQAAGAPTDFTYFLPAPRDMVVWIRKEAVWKRRARHWWVWHFRRTYVRIVKRIPAPLHAWAYARRIRDCFWHRPPGSGAEVEQSGGEFTHKRVTVSIGAGPKKILWLFGRRTKGKKPVYTCHISNATTPVRLATFVRLSASGETARRSLQEAKDNFGLGRYAVRTYPGWHRHVLACLLAYFLRGYGLQEPDGRRPPLS
jgi:SRSO17 transposase